MKLLKIKTLLGGLLLVTAVCPTFAQINASAADIALIRQNLHYSKNPDQLVNKALQVCEQKGFKNVPDCIAAARKAAIKCRNCCNLNCILGANAWNTFCFQCTFTSCPKSWDCGNK